MDSQFNSSPGGGAVGQGGANDMLGRFGASGADGFGTQGNDYDADQAEMMGIK